MIKWAAALSFVFIVLTFWIIYLANTTGNSVLLSIPGLITHGDKIGHVLIYGVLTLLLNIGLTFRKIPLPFCNIYLGTFLIIIFSFAEEFSQRYVKSRTFDTNDLIADALGILIFTCISKYVEQAKHKSHKDIQIEPG